MRLLALEAVFWFSVDLHVTVMERESARVTPVGYSGPDSLGWLPDAPRRLCRALEGLQDTLTEIRFATRDAHGLLRPRPLARTHRCPVCGAKTDRLEEATRPKGDHRPVMVKVGDPMPEIGTKLEFERQLGCRPCTARFWQEHLNGPEYQAWLDRCEEPS